MLSRTSEGAKIFAWIDKKIPEDEVASGMMLQVDVSKLPNGNSAHVLTT